MAVRRGTRRAAERPIMETPAVMYSQPMSGKSRWDKLGPVLVVILIVMAFGLGVMWSKTKTAEVNGGSNPATTTPAAQQQQQPAVPSVSLSTIKGLWSKNVIKFGDNNRKILVVEVEDPSCPYCQIAGGKNSELNSQAGAQFKLVADGGTYVAPEPELKKLVDAGQASMVYIYMPGHGNGEMGMKALYCANEQGRFWDVHNLLFSNAGYNELNNTIVNDKTKSGDLAQFLATAIDPTFLKSCLDSGKYDNRLGEDSTLAKSLGVSGTPGFFVNTTSFDGAYSFSDMKSAVDAALK